MDDRLQKFARLIELGSFTRAARDMHISQPALTLAINKLERELRTPLLIRGHRQLELTKAGELVYEAARENRMASENLRTKLNELAHRRPKVAIGMIDSVAAALTSEVKALDELETRATVSITINNSRYLRAAVENRKIDLAFVVHDAVNNHTNLDAVAAGEEPFLLVCTPDQRDKAQARLDAGKLPDFICYEHHSTTYSYIHRDLRKLRIATQTILYSTNPNIMLHMAMRGRGIAALPYLLVREHLDSGNLVALKRNGKTLTIKCPISAVTLRGKVLPEALENFLKQVRQVLP